MIDPTGALADAYNAALEHEKAGRRHEAARLYRTCLDLEPSDPCGARMRLASMGMGPAPDRAGDAYMATLFDQTADRFDHILTEALGYAVPMQAADWLRANRPGPYARMLDLGCGTGLAGMMMGDMCAHATGVDISGRMIEKADERAAYDALYINEAVHFLDQWAGSGDAAHAPFDLIAATDVLPYFGPLETLFDAIAANAADGARLLVSAETDPLHDDRGVDWSVTAHQRFAHSAAYLRAMCRRAGFAAIELCEPICVRREAGTPVPGFLVVAAKPQAGR